MVVITTALQGPGFDGAVFEISEGASLEEVVAQGIGGASLVFRQAVERNNRMTA
jgi:hypothetical protein